MASPAPLDGSFLCCVHMHASVFLERTTWDLLRAHVDVKKASDVKKKKKATDGGGNACTEADRFSRGTLK